MRIVIEENTWLEVKKATLLNLNGQSVPAENAVIGDMISDAPAASLTKGSDVTGRITNIATFED